MGRSVPFGRAAEGERRATGAPGAWGGLGLGGGEGGLEFFGGGGGHAKEKQNGCTKGESGSDLVSVCICCPDSQKLITFYFEVLW